MKVGLLGERLGHSYSPQIHKELVGERYAYELFERAPEDIKSFVQTGDWDALNVTIPYKKVVMPYLDVITDEAARIGAVNTITRLPDGRLRGDNTDYFGFARTVHAAGVAVKGKTALVLGNGGAAATAVTVLNDMGATVVVLARSTTPVGGITPEPFRGVYARHPDASLVVNCTQVGMYPRRVGQRLLDLTKLPALTAVFDMVYNPAHTAILQQAEELGLPAYNGLLMLVAQAKRAAELFLDERLADDAIDPIVDAITRETGNIILVGMPGCGKSTIAAQLGKALSRPVVDTDELVVKTDGRPIPTIFAEDGEEVFRRLESMAVRTAGMMSGAVIATGGGVVTRTCNYRPLSQNGRIVFLHRDLERLPTNGRPLSQAHPLSALYEARLPLYRRFADVEIDNNGTPDETVSAILDALGYT